MALRRRKTDDASKAPRTELPSLRDLGGAPAPESDDAERYEAWADRLGVKRQAAQAKIRDASLEGGPREPGPSYWTEDVLFMDAATNEDLQRVANPSLEQLRQFCELLQVAEDATLVQINQSYRLLAKKHHPDLYLEADDETRAGHEEKMRAINLAHRVLSKHRADADGDADPD